MLPLIARIDQLYLAWLQRRLEKEIDYSDFNQELSSALDALITLAEYSEEVTGGKRKDPIPLPR